jgi:hypothetical protein
MEPTSFLRRLRIVQTPWLGVYIHWIDRPDEDRDPHDHPWPVVSIILRGGYTERLFTDLEVSTVRERRRWSLHRVPTTVAHQILTVAPRTVTLMLIGRRQRGWGFWTENGFVLSTEYKNIGVGPDRFNS